MKSIRNGHAYNLPVCQLVVVIDDGQQIDRVADTVTVQVRVSYSAVSYLFGAFEHRFLSQFYRIEDKNEINDEKHEKEKDQTEDKEENNKQEQDPRKNRKKRRRK